MGLNGFLLLELLLLLALLLEVMLLEGQPLPFARLGFRGLMRSLPQDLSRIDRPGHDGLSSQLGSLLGSLRPRPGCLFSCCLCLRVGLGGSSLRLDLLDVDLGGRC